MTAELALTIVAVVACVCVVAVSHQWSHRLRDELTANRMERAELVQRVQAPDSAVSQYAYNQMVLPPAAGTEEGFEEAIERAWADSEESLIPFDADLADLAIDTHVYDGDR
jgi:hypothetical protein